MREHHYEINVSDEEQELALNSVKVLIETLDGSPIADVSMEKLALAFSPYEIEVDEFDDLKGGKYLLVFDVDTLTAGKLRHLTPRLLKTLLFNRDVFEVVVSAMVDALHWMADEEFLGSTPTNERRIAMAFKVIVDAAVKSLGTRLVRAPGH